MSSVSLVTTVLESEGYDVAIWLGHLRLVVAKDCMTETYDIRQAMKDSNRPRVLRCTNIASDFIAAVNGDDMEVWLIPSVDVAGLKTIRLGKRFNQYKYVVRVYKQDEDGTELSLNSLKFAAKDAAKKMKEMKHDKD